MLTGSGGTRSVEERLTMVMALPLDSVVALDRQVCPPPVISAQWDLAPADRWALARWGLPDDLNMRPSFQTDIEPSLVPNVAGEFEARLISADDRLYRLGWLGSHDLTPKVGAVAGDGRILGVRPAPITAADLHPSLKDHYRNLYQPSVVFINSSAAQFIEVVWRWRAAQEVLLADLEAPGYGAPMEAQERYLSRADACRRIVLRGIERIDAAVVADDPAAIWVEMVTDLG